jgi:hypothetical protein
VSGITSVGADSAIRYTDHSRADPSVKRIAVHLAFLTAFQSTPFGPEVDRKAEAARLQADIVEALRAADIPAGVAVQFGTIEVTARITTPDADAAFAAVAPVLRASRFCADGYVLLRYGPTGAPERQLSLGRQAGNAAAALQPAVGRT